MKLVARGDVHFSSSSPQAVAQEKQQLKESPPDILICTPGRLADHFLGRGTMGNMGICRGVPYRWMIKLPDTEKTLAVS